MKKGGNDGPIILSKNIIKIISWQGLMVSDEKCTVKLTD